MRRTYLAAVLAVAVLGATASNAFGWEGAQWLPNTCGADFVAPAGNGNWWIRISDESGTLAETTSIPAAKAFPASAPLTMFGLSKDLGFHYVKYEAANAAGVHGPGGDGYVTYTQPQWNCSAIQGPQGRDGPPGPPGPEPPRCVSRRVIHVKVGNEFRGQRITSARLTWANGTRHTTAIRRSDGRLHAVVSFRGISSPERGLWAITLSIRTADGKHATLTRNQRICSPEDGNLNFSTDVHRDST